MWIWPVCDVNGIIMVSFSTNACAWLWRVLYREEASSIGFGSMFASLPSDPPGNSPGVVPGACASAGLMFEKEDAIDALCRRVATGLKGCTFMSGAYISTKVFVLA